MEQETMTAWLDRLDEIHMEVARGPAELLELSRNLLREYVWTNFYLGV